MKFELQRLQRGSSEEDLKKEIIRVAELISDDFITVKKFDILSKISASFLRHKFGSWENVLQSCNLGHRYSGQTVSKKMTNQVAKNLSNTDLITELKRVATLLQKNELSQTDFNQNSDFSSSAISRRFGSWQKGLISAGLETVKMAKRYTELDYFENLLEVWTHYGRQPKYREIDLPPSTISSGAYERKWSKWSNALLAFIEFANGEQKTEIENKSENSNIKNEIIISKKDGRDISIGLRYKVLSRDRFRCVKCGGSPATDLKCKLHIDHILPFSKGGKTSIENLQTSCEKCNLGKGNRYSE